MEELSQGGFGGGGSADSFYHFGFTGPANSPSQVVAGWIQLLGRHAVEGAAVFDLQVIATMLANGVQRICTFNPGDFQVFAELTVATPT
jgi:predicted nucleic acid-binding protein